MDKLITADWPFHWDNGFLVRNGDKAPTYLGPAGPVATPAPPTPARQRATAARPRGRRCPYVIQADALTEPELPVITDPQPGVGVKRGRRAQWWRSRANRKHTLGDHRTGMGWAWWEADFVYDF